MAVYKCGGAKRKDSSGQPICSYESDKTWTGKTCPGCGRFYNIIKVGAETSSQRRTTLSTMSEVKPKPRISTGIPEVDEVINGGFPKGSVIIISGPPGTGKSTLLLSISNNIATTGKIVVYSSGEQKTDDIADIASRLGATSENVVVMGLEGDVYKICDECESHKATFLVVDSLQTAFLDDCTAEEGSAEQCKAVGNYLTAWAKRTDTIILIVSHVNKAGDLAGPKSVEHLVDATLELDPAPEYDSDGEITPESKNYRKLFSGAKSRIGPSYLETKFNMTNEGMKPVKPKKKRSHLEVVRNIRDSDEDESQT